MKLFYNSNHIEVGIDEAGRGCLLGPVCVAAVIMNDILEYAKIQWSHNKNIVMVGHYHQQKIINNNEHNLVFLGDWLTKFTVTKLDQSGIWQGDYKEFIKLA